MDAQSLPLFPLHTVLFPGGPLSLRIFEPRYLDMVRRCLKDGGGFGVLLILEGAEAGAAAQLAAIGTRARGGFRHAAGRAARHRVPRRAALRAAAPLAAG